MRSIIILLVVLISFSATAQTNCSDVKNGVFHYYPNKLKEKFLITRDKSGQREINLNSNDTTFWKINWQSDCRFSLQFLKGTRAKTDEEKEYYNQHTFNTEILGVTKDYYLFKTTLDSLSSGFSVSDTAWRSPRK